MDNGFDELAGLEGFGEAGQEAGEAANTEGVKEEKAEKKYADSSDKAKAEVKQLMADPNYSAVRNSRSNDIEVVNTLAFSTDGGMVSNTQAALDAAVKAGTVTVVDDDDETTPLEVSVDPESKVISGFTKRAKAGSAGKYVIPLKKNSPDPKTGKFKKFRALASSAEIIGVRIRNVSEEPIKYTTCVYAQNDAGKFIGQEVEKVLMPGEETDLNRKYTTLLSIRPEFNNTFKNGTIVAKGLAGSDLEKILEQHYFQFNKDSGKDIHDEAVMIMISEETEVGDKTINVVTPEFQETFGYMNNVTEKPKARTGNAGGGRKSDAPKPTTQEITAYVLRKKMGMQ